MKKETIRILQKIGIGIGILIIFFLIVLILGELL